MADGQVRCPVCGRLAGPRARACEQCGWTLSGPLRVGPVTEQMREDFETALRRQRRALDARVAARITEDPGAYQDYIHGGRPDAAEWRAARRAAAEDAASAADENDLVARLGDLLTELRPGTSITVVEVGGDGIIVTRADLDRFGSPRVSDIGETAAWTTLLPVLSGETKEQRFQLAGGMSQPDRELALADLDRQMPEIPGGPVIIICRLAGWEFPERAAETASRPGSRMLRVAGAADATPARMLLAALAAGAALKMAYQLMVAVIDPESGAVSVQARRLFAPGDRPGTRASLSLRRLPGDDSEQILGIFTEGGPAADPLALYRARPPASVFSLHAVLDGPGQVRIVQPEDVTEYSGTWDEVRGQVPARVDTASRPVDLVCAIDLSGSLKAVRGRRHLVRDLLRLLASEYGDSPWLRVGVVTCTEHVFKRGVRADPVTEFAELGPPEDAATWLEAAPKETNARYPDLAPVEDLLHEAFGLLRGSHANGRAAMLVTVAGRPPHPWPQPRDNRLPCPNHYMWAEEIGNLTRRADARCLMVTDDPEIGVDGIAGWRKLGPDGLRTLADTSARQLAEDLGLVAGKAQRIPLPQPGEFGGGIY